MRITVELFIGSVLLVLCLLSSGSNRIHAHREDIITANTNLHGSGAGVDTSSINQDTLSVFSGEDSSVELIVPRGHNLAITSLNIGVNGELVSTDHSRVVHFWDLNTMTYSNSIENAASVSYKNINSSGYTITGIFSSELKHIANVYEGGYNCNEEIGCTILDGYLDRGLSSDGNYVVVEDYLLGVSAEAKDTIRLGFTPRAFSRDGDCLWYLRGDSLIRHDYPYDPDKAARISYLPGINSEAPSMGIQKGGRYLLANSAEVVNDSVTHSVWDLRLNKLLCSLALPVNARISEVSPGGEYLLLFSLDSLNETRRTRYSVANKIVDQVYDRDVGTKISSTYCGPAIFARDGEIVCCPTVIGEIDIYDTQSGELINTLRSGVRNVSFLASSNDGTAITIGEHNDHDSLMTIIEWQWNYGNHIFNTNVERMKASIEEKRATKPDRLEVRNKTIQDTLHGKCVFNILKYCEEELVNNERVEHYDENLKFCFNQGLSAGAVYENDLVAVGTICGVIFIFSEYGKYQYALEGHIDQIKDIIFIHNGNKLITTSYDGTTRIWDLKTRKELAKIYVVGNRDWVVFNEDLLFDASPAAMSELKFQVIHNDGNALGQESEIIELGQMKNRFYEPGLLQKLLGYSDQPIRAVEGLSDLPLYPEIELFVEEQTLRVKLTPRSGGIGRVSLSVNGKELLEDIRPLTVRDGLDDSSPSMEMIEVDLSQAEFQKFFVRENTLAIRAYNRQESLYSRDHEIEYSRPDRPELVARGSGGTTLGKAELKKMAESASLFVVCVGTSRYASRSLRLTYPDLDARVMARSLSSVGNQLFSTKGRVEVHCLTTDKANQVSALEKEGIVWQYARKKAVQDVFADIAERAKAQDVVVVYLSGHGKTINVDGSDMFHYLTHETTSLNEIDQTILKNVAISSAELTNWTKEIAAYKQVFMVDACNAGQLIDDLGGSRNLNSSQIRALERMSDRTGNYLISGSAANKVSYEANNYGQGLLTYALLKGMKGEALIETDSTDFFVGVTELFEYAKNEVGQLAARNGGIQEPQVSYPLKAGTFALGISNDNVEIPLGREKPILVRSSLQSETDYADVLGLEIELNQRCQLETDKGQAAAFIYLDVDRLSAAYQLRARYQRRGDGKISVKGILYRKGKEAIPIEVKPHDREEVVEALFKAIKLTFAKQ